MRNCLGILTVLLSLTSWQCSREQSHGDIAYSEEDFVTDSYLSYQDSLVHAWNQMVRDDNEKLTALQQLLIELRNIQAGENQAQLIRLESRLTQLHRIRYTQKSMANPDVIEEYDFASAALVREVLTTAESSTAYAHNVVLQQLVEQIQLADERIENYRADYDDLVTHYNSFIELNKDYLGQMGRDSLKKRTRFELVSIN